MTNRITITLGEPSNPRDETTAPWLAIYSGPHAKEIGELFDTCTLPTAFTVRTPLAEVVKQIAARNPGATVEHAS